MRATPLGGKYRHTWLVQIISHNQIVPNYVVASSMPSGFRITQQDDRGTSEIVLGLVNSNISDCYRITVVDRDDKIGGGTPGPNHQVLDCAMKAGGFPANHECTASGRLQAAAKAQTSGGARQHRI